MQRRSGGAADTERDAFVEDVIGSKWILARRASSVDNGKPSFAVHGGTLQASWNLAIN